MSAMATRTAARIESDRRSQVLPPNRHQAVGRPFPDHSFLTVQARLGTLKKQIAFESDEVRRRCRNGKPQPGAWKIR
jgi:hypothetical protein